MMPPDSHPQPEVTVVICSHNGASTLGAALSSLRDQSLTAERYAVIVVDDGSTDGTAEVAQAAGAAVVRLSPGRGLAGARNAGVRVARAPIIAFTDDDCEADRDWLTALIGAFSAPEVDAVGGRVVPGGPDGFVLRYLRARNPLVPLGARPLSGGAVDRLRVYLRENASGAAELRSGDHLYSVVGANMAFRRDRVREWGGFDEAFRFGYEEEDLCRRAQGRSGDVRLVYEPTATVVHSFRPSLRDTLRRSRAYGHGIARAAIKHANVRPIVYPFPLLCLAAISAGMLTRRSQLALLGALAPLLAYPRWLADLSAPAPLEAPAYPYLQLAQEVYTMRGELDGHREGYVPVSADEPTLGHADGRHR